MTDDGELEYVLGMQIRRHRKNKEIFISSQQKIMELLKDFNMANCIPAATPMDNVAISADDCPDPHSSEWSEMQAVPYRECVGRLTHLMRTTRPDLAFSVSVVNRYLHNPGRPHWNAVKRILRYLQGTAHFHLRIAPTTVNLTGYTDADWGGSKDNSKSTSGSLFFLGSGLVSWSSKIQPQIATSSTHAEYIAAYHATSECLWIRTFLSELGLLNPALPTLLSCDNDAAIKIAKFHMITPRSKHFDTKFHFLRDKVATGEIALSFCPGKDNVADLLTKALPKLKFISFRSQLGLSDSLVHDKSTNRSASQTSEASASTSI
jgi:hypothetical protein